MPCNMVQALTETMGVLRMHQVGHVELCLMAVGTLLKERGTGARPQRMGSNGPGREGGNET